MTGLIKADLYRILRKKTLWIIVLVVAALLTVMALATRSGIWNGFAFANNESMIMTGFGKLFIGVALFLGVYSDEFTARSMLAAIGRGISRPKVILSKIITCTIVSALVFMILLVFQLVLSAALGAHMSAVDVKYLALSTLKAAYCVAGYTPLAAVIIYLTDSSAFSVFIQVFLITILPGLLTLMEFSLLFSNLHPSRYTLEGFANRGFSDLMLTGSGAGTLLAGFLLYLAAAYVLSWLFFIRKELDF